jgi:molybdopterin-synthase adenylyltransferase
MTLRTLGDGVRSMDLAAPAIALEAVRADARDVAARALAERGFLVHSAPDEYWAGKLSLPRSRTTLPVEVRLPSSFPDALPNVAVRHDCLPKRVAHVVDGTVCVVPTSNVFVDADRPADLVAEALRRAAEVLDQGLLGETDADLDVEFQAYWIPTDFTTTLSYCDVDGPARQIVMCQLTGGSKLIDESRMLADRVEDVERWARHIGARVGAVQTALFVPVSASIPLALPDQPTTVSQVALLIARHATPSAQQLFHRAIERADYPQFVVLSMPEALAGAGRRLAAIHIKRPDRAVLKEAQRGFRPGHLPAGRVLARIGRVAVERFRVQRVDSAYLGARGGVAMRLTDATVTVVGVGAVGSEVARNLAAIGVGHIRLVDPDGMAAENVHRHVLGMNSTGYTKATALKVELEQKFPHLDIDLRTLRVEKLLTDEPAFLLEADLIFLATGEETLERRLNRLLLGGPPRVHAWLEPLGIGGHAFACGGPMESSTPNEPAAGCFECLYRPDDNVGLINRTALTAPGQEIRQSLAGCAGTFSPFSPLDARRTAVDATELAARVLTRAVTLPALVTWRGMHTPFEAAAYQMSVRARQISPGSRVEVSSPDLVRQDCTICSVSVQAPAQSNNGSAEPTS